MKPAFTIEHQERLRQRADLVEQELAGLPEFSWDTRKAYDDAVDAILQRLEQATGGVDYVGRSSSDFYEVRMLHVRATSTSSITGALRNWIAQARKKAGA